MVARVTGVRGRAVVPSSLTTAAKLIGYEVSPSAGGFLHCSCCCSNSRDLCHLYWRYLGEWFSPILHLCVFTGLFLLQLVNRREEMVGNIHQFGISSNTIYSNLNEVGSL